MPCDSVAIARATLDASIEREILGKAPVVEALRKWLEQAYAADARLYYSEPTGLAIAVYPRDRTSPNGFEVMVYGGQVNLRPFNRMGEAFAAAELPKVRQFLANLARYAARERTIQTVKSKYRVLRDELRPTQAGPARVLTLEV